MCRYWRKVKGLGPNWVGGWLVEPIRGVESTMQATSDGSVLATGSFDEIEDNLAVPGAATRAGDGVYHRGQAFASDRSHIRRLQRITFPLSSLNRH